MSDGLASEAMLVSSRRQPSVARLAAPLAALVLLAGCSVVPRPFTAAERASQVAADRVALYAEQEPVTGPVSLEEATARALKYNLDRRLAVMDQALRLRQLDLSRYDLLPRLVADAGYTSRSNELYSVSRDAFGNIRDRSDATTAVERNRFSSSLELSWNILDFGVSYYTARQNADRALIAQERQRRAVHSIVKEVRAAFWRAAAAQRLQGAVTPVLAEARRALADSQAVERERLRPLIETLRYQRSLVEVVRQLEALDQDLAIAKAQLAALMNLPPGTAYSLAVPTGAELPLPSISVSIEEMERLALLNRPELREAAYQGRITALETRRALLSLLPGLRLYGSLNYDSNSYLLNQEWAEAGARVTWNLMNLLAAPANRRVQQAQEDFVETQRLALSMTALAQLHIAHQQYLSAREQYQQAAQLSAIEGRIYDITRRGEAGQAQSVLDRVLAGTAAIAAEFRRDLAYAELQNAVASFYVSTGLDPLPEAVAAHDIPTLSAALRRVSEEWMSGRVTLPAAPPPASASGT